MKKLFLSIILIFTLSLSLFACGNTDNTGSNGGGEESGGDTPADYTNYLFAEGIVPTVISVEPEATKKTVVLTNGIEELLGKAPVLYQSDRVKDSGHEIIIGHARRELSAKAYEALAAVKAGEALKVMMRF